MAKCELHLRELVKAIEPTPTQKIGAARSHSYLREILVTGQFAGRIRGSYLSGSYARDTAIAPLDDVDIIFLIDPTKWSSYYIFSNPPPATVLESFADAIRYRYDQSPVRTQRRSVCLQLNHLDIDVVPAIVERENTDFIKIPDRKENVWIKSAPQAHTKYATWLNQKLHGNFKPLVKLLKYWNSKLPNTARIKSFAVETIAARLFTAVGASSLQEGLTSYFDFLAHFGGRATRNWQDDCGISLNFWSCNVPDIAKSGSNVVANLDADTRNKLIDHAARSRDRMLEANSAYSMETSVRRVGDALRI